ARKRPAGGQPAMNKRLVDCVKTRFAPSTYRDAALPKRTLPARRLGPCCGHPQPMAPGHQPVRDRERSCKENPPMADIVIAGATRAAVTWLNGALAPFTAHYLGQVAISEALRRAKVEPGQVSEVIMGQILSAGMGQNPARQASIGAGLPVEVPAWGV